MKNIASRADQAVKAGIEAEVSSLQRVGLPVGIREPMQNPIQVTSMSLLTSKICGLAFIFSLHAQAAWRSGKANANPQFFDVRQKSAAEVRRHCSIPASDRAAR